MGLDMYLYRHPKGETEAERDALQEKLFKEGFDAYNEKYSRVRRIAYWRKVNFLHGYIVKEYAEGVDECQEIPLDIGDIKRIQKRVKEVWDILEAEGNLCEAEPVKDKGGFIDRCVFKEGGKRVAISKLDFENPELEGYWLVDERTAERCREILPPCDGFFFGSQSMDYWYVYDVWDTVRKLEEVIREDNGKYQYVYQASW